MARKYKKFARKRKGKAVPKSVKRYVNQALDNRLEDKFFASTATATFTRVNAPYPQFSVIGGITQGTGDGQRSGDKIHLKSVDLRFNYNIPVAATNQPCYVRLVVVRQKMKSTGVVPRFADPNSGYLYDSTNGRGIISPVNPTTGVIYERLYDRVHKLQPQGYGGEAANCFVHVHKSWKNAGSLVQYEPNSANQNKGDIVVFMATDAVAGQSVAVEFESMVRYEDA